jgi:hypothetical protein
MPPARAFFLLVAASSLIAAAAAAAEPKEPKTDGETLYNGIVLPKDWPPKNVTPEFLKSRKPPPEPFYLTNPPAVIPIDVGRQLFVDNFLIDKTTLKTVHHLPAYHPSNPVMPSGMAFSGGAFYDPKDDLFKMWMHGGGTSYSTSKDGIKWDKPKSVQGQGSDSQCVWLDLEAKDSAKRFIMTKSVVAGTCKGHIYFSADGVSWGSEVGTTGSWGDRSTFFYNPFRKLWVISARHGWSQPRFRKYWEVKEIDKGPYWGAPGQPGTGYWWCGADELDPERPDYKIPCELYNLDCAGYESLMLGMFSIWRGQPPPREKPNEVCVGYSRDGFNWSRPDRRAFCPVSEKPGDWNYSNVQSVGGCCLIVKDQLYIYVSGRGKGTVTALATMRRDGFTSMDAGADGGDLTTRPVRFKGKHLFVNLQAPQGEFTAELLDAQSAPIPPFTRDNCIPLSVDRTLQPVRWKGADDLSKLAGQTVKFRFHLKNGSLYAFWVSPDATGASYGYVAAGGPGFTSNQDTVGVPDALSSLSPKGEPPASVPAPKPPADPGVKTAPPVDASEKARKSRLSMGRNYEKNGMPESAQEIYREIIEKFPGTPEAAEARERLAGTLTPDKDR